MRTWHSGLLFRAFLFVLVFGGTAWLVTDGNTGVGLATVLGMTATFLTLIASTVPWPRLSTDAAELAKAADLLAREVRRRVTIAQNRLLADTARARPADLSFVQPTSASWPIELLVWRGDSHGDSGSLADIAEFYAHVESGPGLADGRLMILGEAAAGKTVVANQLLNDLAARFLGPDVPRQARRRVPVRISLPGFDPGTGDGRIANVSSRLGSWITRNLVKAFKLPWRVACALVQQGWILPVLDGLDEMDSDPGDPIRASAVLQALNYPMSDGIRPCIVMCRSQLYRVLAGRKSGPGREPVLQDASVVELQRLQPDQIAAYVAARFPAMHSGRSQPCWQRLVDRLRAEQDSPLLAVLASPLRLLVAVAAYRDDPVQLERFDGLSPEDIDKSLLEHIVPVVTQQYPKPESLFERLIAAVTSQRSRVDIQVPAP